VRHFGAQFSLPGATGVGRPVAAEVVNLGRAREFRQLSECCGKNRLVALPIVRRSEGAADWMIDEGGARRGDFAHDVVGRADDQRRDSTGFDHMGDETDGLMTKRSIGNQQGKIDFGFFQVNSNRWRQFVFDFCMFAQSSHE
jgi:hypothetical protein